MLRHHIANYRASAFEWGSYDCVTLAADWVRDATGFDPVERCRGYRSKSGALKKLAASGFASAADLVEANFVRIPSALAQRGDLGYTSHVPDRLSAPLIIDGDIAIGMSEAGIVVVSRACIVQAYAV